MCKKQPGVKISEDIAKQIAEMYYTTYNLKLVYKENNCLCFLRKREKFPEHKMPPAEGI